MSNKKFILILIILIFLFAFLSYWHFQKFQQTSEKVDLSKNLPKIEMPEINLKNWLDYNQQLKRFFPQFAP